MNEIERAAMWVVTWTAVHESLITWTGVAAWIACAATEIAFRFLAVACKK